MITLQQAEEEHKQLNNNQKYKVFKYMLYGFYGHSITYVISEYFVENLNRVLVLGTTVFEAYNVFYSINNVVMSVVLAYFLFMDYSWFFRRFWPPYIISYFFHNVINLYNYKNEYQANYFDGKQAADIDVQFRYCKFIVHPFVLVKFSIAILVGLVATLLSIKISYKLKKFYDTQNMEKQLMWDTLPDDIEQNMASEFESDNEQVYQEPVEIDYEPNPINLQRSETFETIYNRPATRQMPNQQIGEHKTLAELKQDFIDKSQTPIRSANRILEPTEPKNQLTKLNSLFNMPIGRMKKTFLEEPKRLTKSTTCASIYNQAEPPLTILNPQSKMIKSQTFVKFSDMNANIPLSLSKSAHFRKIDNLNLNQPQVEQGTRELYAPIEKPPKPPMTKQKQPLPEPLKRTRNFQIKSMSNIKQYCLETDVNQIRLKRIKSLSATRHAVDNDTEVCSEQIGWNVENNLNNNQTNYDYSGDFQTNEQSFQEDDIGDSIGEENLSSTPY